MYVIMIFRKSNIALIGLIFLLIVAIYSLNIESGETRAVSKLNAANKTVLLDPGHGGEDPGAVSDFSGLKEKDVNLAIAHKLKKLLEQDGINILMTREEDRLEYTPGTTNIIQKRKQDLQRRKKMMDEAGADIVVSIHLNKFPQTQYYGAQTFFPPKSVESEKLAVCIQKALKEKLDPTNDRQALLKKEEIIILRNLKTTTAMVECGFLSHKEEEGRLATKEYQSRIAEAIRAGILEYFNVPNY
jgi:N-acetylmuramoyl-L-alanine amidase